MDKKINCVEINGLFTRFDYIINLNRKDIDLSIITAPNGYGKSTILNIISNFQLGNFDYFCNLSFSRIFFILSDKSTFEILKHEGNLTVRMNKEQVINFKSVDNSNANRHMRHLPDYIKYLGDEVWVDDRDDEILSKEDIYERFGLRIGFQVNNDDRLKLHEIKESLGTIKVFTIPTTRLKRDLTKRNSRRGTEFQEDLMINHISDQIRELIRKAVNRQFEISRELESTFPWRLMNQIQENKFSKDEVLELIDATQQDSKRYSQLGLVPEISSEHIYRQSFREIQSDGPEFLVLKLYFEDIKRKFEVFETLAQKLEVFTNSINSLIAFKRIELSLDDGIIVKTTDKESIVVNKVTLSSGEQHLLVLLGELIFEVEEGTLILIDEPEISFHPAWQESFIDIIEKISHVNNFSIIIATHSPILIGNRWEQVIELAEQNSYSSIQ